MLKKIDVSLVLLSILTARIVIMGASIGDALALIGLAGLYGFTQFMTSRKIEVVNETIKLDVEQLKNSVNGLKMAKVSGRF